jgi:ssDNA-binding Zn-finger/Zn-ribbon topoisomerase 1
MSESDMPQCPRCGRSDMVRLYREDYFCERCSGWLTWLEGSAWWDKRHRKPVAVAEAPIPSDPAPETAQSEESQAPASAASAPPVPRRKGKAAVQTWECPHCRAQYPKPKGAGVCPACAMGENPETVALVPLEEET